MDSCEGGNAGPKPRKGTKKVKIEPEEMTEEERKKVEATQVKKEALTFYKGVLQTAKRQADKTRAEMILSKGHCDQLCAKGYPPTMADHFKSVIDPVLAGAQDLLDKWGIAAKLETDQEPAASLREKAASLDELRTTVETMQKDVDVKVKGLKTLVK